MKYKMALVLLASEKMDDPFFEKTVVLVIEQTEGSCMGFILNKETPFNLEDIMSVNEQHSAVKHKVFIGGPVETSSLYYIHRCGDRVPDGMRISNSSFFSGDYNELLLSIEKGILKEEEVSFFLGYTGWSSPQLEQEMKDGYWVKMAIDNLEGLLDQAKKTDTLDLWNTLWKEHEALSLAEEFYPQNTLDN